MRKLSIDIETYSGYDLKVCGSYKYVESPDFRILLFAYAYDTDPVTCLDLTTQEIPEQVVNDIFDPQVEKHAFNANFERTCLAKHFGRPMPPEQWWCTMVKCGMVGLPMKLDMVSKVMQLHKGKLDTGTTLINFFCKPRTATKNDDRISNIPSDLTEEWIAGHQKTHEAILEKWVAFKEYCKRDVEAEREIARKLAFYEIPAKEKQLWNLDQLINDRGVLVDVKFVQNTIKIYERYQRELIVEAQDLTGLDNPNSVKQLVSWLHEETEDVSIKSLAQDKVLDLLTRGYSDRATRLLEIRQELALSSVKKYYRMLKMVCNDGRFRGVLQFYGAPRTGRYSSKGIQLHNLTKHYCSDETLDRARNMILEGKFDLFEVSFGNIPKMLSQLIRTSFIAAPGHRFIIPDFAAIEARVIAALSGEEWRLEVFRGDGKIYEVSASKMFKIPLESISYKNEKGETVKGPNYHFRANGKVSELALGFQGSVGALLNMGAEREGLVLKTDDDATRERKLKPMVELWRIESPKIVKAWSDFKNAAVKAIRNKGTRAPLPYHSFIEVTQRGIMFMTLPNGRKLAYLEPRIVEGQYGPSLEFTGMGSEEKKARVWGRQRLYGGSLVQNWVQAVARDCLNEAILRIVKEGYQIAFSVHDEVVIEAPYGFGSIEHVNSVMSQPIPWAPGLPLKAAAHESVYYKKD